METSLRFGKDCQSLRIHAKEKFPLDSITPLQGFTSNNVIIKVHGELDTRDGKTGHPAYVGAIIRRFYPNLSASLGVGVHYDKHEKLTYRIRAKKAFPVTGDSNLSFNVKGFCKIDQEFIKRKSNGAAELVWTILNFQKDQDVRLKIGYEVTDKVPYLQIKENKWTVNVDMDGKWNIRYDL